MSSFFFFQAEDGIRDWSVTGVQTCALPIFFCQMPPYDVADHGVVAASASNGAGRMWDRRTYRRSRSEEHTSELQSLTNLVCRLLLEKKKNKKRNKIRTIMQQGTTRAAETEP